MDLTGLGSVFSFGSKIIDKIFPDKEAADRAKLELLRMQQEGGLKELETSMAAIIAEAQSADPWTSRARPSFLYVMYLMILAAIPMGLVHAWRPDVAAGVVAGMAGWLSGIPEELYWMFSVGYLGYTGARTFDKRKGKP